jgi:pilus assembly protein Flp/PilA
LHQNLMGPAVRIIIKFLRDQSGVTAIEYAVLGGMLAVAIIVGASALGTQLNTTYQGVAEAFPDTGTP